MSDRKLTAGVGELKRLIEQPRSQEPTPSKSTRFGWIALAAIAYVVVAIVLMSTFLDALIMHLMSADPIRH
ncbi:hypothetical protein FCJ61_37060 [Burkholderia metallica]|uniref:hypothetical protein n=1 Tax=Burkholderia metallica TaxID=488729 RepID=UPI00157B8891|nr:hypothetical protein [Burkholderia metallica]NTZ88448.1 hypothetical protein [Burkholderia metallica]